MSKKPVAYIKPQDPSFLVKLKKDAGYVEGPTVDTKREKHGFESGSDDDLNEEQPVVVVLKDGDLTAEEADRVAKEKEAEEASKKADLTQRVIFAPKRPKRTADESHSAERNPKKSKEKIQSKKPLLSFDEDED